mmetsp:Transcript_19303/g.32720  ORF Transcript_19303/g.32720 Transcript_19303/m.32720 type:complete len:334 (+) Transcript_19303:806-1807(+)
MAKKIQQYSRARQRWIWATKMILARMHVQKSRHTIKQSSLAEWYEKTYAERDAQREAQRWDKHLWNQKQLGEERQRKPPGRRSLTGSTFTAVQSSLAKVVRTLFGGSDKEETFPGAPKTTKMTTTKQQQRPWKYKRTVTVQGDSSLPHAMQQTEAAMGKVKIKPSAAGAASYSSFRNSNSGGGGRGGDGKKTPHQLHQQQQSSSMHLLGSNNNQSHGHSASRLSRQRSESTIKRRHIQRGAAADEANGHVYIAKSNDRQVKHLPLSVSGGGAAAAATGPAVAATGPAAGCCMDDASSTSSYGGEQIDGDDTSVASGSTCSGMNHSYSRQLPCV